MSGTYSKINYNLRIAKSVERKMFIEVIKRLSIFRNLQNYQYIGFGSAYFNDFILYHKHFGIHDMISIEKEIDDTNRFKFNKPYSCIRMKFGDSNEILPLLKWRKKAIVWLDYDYHLNQSVLDDINTVFSKAHSGSLIIVTVKAHPDNVNTQSDQERNDTRLAELLKRINKDKIPYEIKGKDLTLKKLHTVYRSIMINEINSCLTQRNGILDLPHKMVFNQIFNITYQDGAKMLTIGGILNSNKDQTLVDLASFKDLSFYSNNADSFFIDPPNLTFKELKFLDGNLPTNIDLNSGIFKNRRKNLPGLSSDDIINYGKIYRYFPTFTEALV